MILYLFLCCYTLTFAFVPNSQLVNRRSSNLHDISNSNIDSLTELPTLIKNEVDLQNVEGVLKDISSTIPNSISSIKQIFSDDINKMVHVLEKIMENAPSAGMNEQIEKLSQEIFNIVTGNTIITQLSEIMRNNELVQGIFIPQAIVVFGLVNIFYRFITAPETFDKAPYEPGTSTYDLKKADNFYKKRPLQVAKRILKLVYLTGSFSTGILFDWLILGKLFKDEEYSALRKNEPSRAKIALGLCTKLGPTFIKLGQAASIRTDLIPEAYALELRQLQDAVPPFDSEIARKVLRKELGVDDLSEIFSSLSEEPVASASIGQVYKGTLKKTGQEVAIKVQRPGILAEIALDLYALRLLAPIQTILQNKVNGIETSKEDIDTAISLVDEWGRGFVAETDYKLEARNTITFEEAMRKRGLEAVCAPPVIEEYVNNKILLTEWIEGTRLDLDASPDVPRLCGVAINAYLTMLLDTGTLHCDPHPGNLLRTTDGKLCILDWGMTLSVPPDLQYALLELIAHINVEDYNNIPQDFINLGFSPEGVTADRLKTSGITEGLTFAFRQLSQGGGPKKIQERVKEEFKERYGSDLSDQELREKAKDEMIQTMETQLESEGVDVKGVTNVMEEMSRRNRELFQLPPYVLYVARAFSTLEGIGLTIDENYAIVQECYPYLARRLFTDKSPRAKKALRAMLGLSEENESTILKNNSQQEDRTNGALQVVQAGTSLSSSKVGTLSPRKLIEMSDGFASYTAATSDVDRDAGQAAAALEFTKLLLDEKGSTLQDILIEETSKFVDAAARSTLKATLVDSAPAKAAKTVLETQRQIIESSPLANLLPKQLKDIVDGTTQIPHYIESLFESTHDPQDETILRTATELRNALESRLTTNDDEKRISVPTESSETIRETIRSLLGNEETRDILFEQVPGIAALSRRLGAGLLRRAAYRTDQTHVIPDDARQLIIRANRRLADVIDMPEQEEELIQQK